MAKSGGVILGQEVHAFERSNDSPTLLTHGFFKSSTDPTSCFTGSQRRSLLFSFFMVRRLFMRVYELVQPFLTHVPVPFRGTFLNLVQSVQNMLCSSLSNKSQGWALVQDVLNPLIRWWAAASAVVVTSERCLLADGGPVNSDRSELSSDSVLVDLLLLK